ncbi:hypothetical protein HJFPF1_03954 [Paramyrothecium foliicola]|nr:hypothetical protein HJFPF1_03954 [Paramyrothecium foliicola]
MSLLPDDPQQRRVAIDSFLAALSPWELLDIRHRIRNGQIRIRIAGLEHLPAELIGSIGLLLHVNDLLKCRQVSKAWQAAWDQSAVAALICRYRFPGLLQMPDNWQNPSQHLIEASKEYLRRHQGTEFPNHVSWDINQRRLRQRSNEDLGPFTITEPRLFCSKGLLSWQANGSDHVYIDDLRAKTHRCIRFGESLLAGHRLHLKAATTNLLVMLQTDSNNTGRVLQIFNLRLCETRKFTLPSAFHTCYAQDDHVVVITQPGAVYAYVWGSKLTVLSEAYGTDIDSSGWRPQQVPGVLFHPTNQNILFLVWLLKLPTPTDSDDVSQFALAVNKYDNLQLVQKFEKHIQDIGPKRPISSYSEFWSYRVRPYGLADRFFEASSVKVGQACQKMNAFGLYMLILYDAGRRRMRLGDEFDTRYGLQNTIWVTECFDTLNEVFYRYSFEEAEDTKFPPTFWDARDESAYVTRARFYDDAMVLQYSKNGSAIQGPQSFQAYRAHLINDQEIVPGVDYKSHSWQSNRLRVGPCLHGGLLFLEEQMSVLASASHYHIWLSEASPPLDEEWAWQLAD